MPLSWLQSNLLGSDDDDGGAYGLLSPQAKLMALFQGLTQAGAGIARGGFAQGMEGFGQGVNKGLQQGMQYGLLSDKLRETAKKRAALTKIAEANPQLADLFAANPEMALGRIYPSPKDRFIGVRGVGVVDIGGNQPSVSLPEPNKPPSAVQEYEYAKDRGFTGTLLDYQTAKAAASKSNISLNVEGGPNFGPIPTGYFLSKSGDSWRLTPIPGGPAELALQREMDALAEAQKGRTTTADVVSQDIHRIMGLMDQAVLPTTGAFGPHVAKVGGTAAHDISRLLETVKGNTAFDKLTEMRKASPTGAALGNVTDREMALLAAVRGNLEQSQSDEQLRRNLIRLHNVTMDVVHGPGQGPARISETTKPVAGIPNQSNRSVAAAPKPASTPAGAERIPVEGDVAINHQTGQMIILRGGRWVDVPPGAVATMPQGVP